MWAKIITIKRTKDLNYFSLCAFHLFNTRVSQFEFNYWNKWTFPRHSNLLRCTCIYIYIKYENMWNYICISSLCLSIYINRTYAYVLMPMFYAKKETYFVPHSCTVPHTHPSSPLQPPQSLSEALLHESNTKHTKGLLLESASWPMRINVGDME